MESQPQNPEFRINPENFHPWFNDLLSLRIQHLKPVNPVINALIYRSYVLQYVYYISLVCYNQSFSQE